MEQKQQTVHNKKEILSQPYIFEMLKQHEEFLVIGLTGRVGSGCSEAADILSRPINQIGLQPIHPGDMGLADDKERDRRILYRYATHHWMKFDIIKVRTIIASYIFSSNTLSAMDFFDRLYELTSDKAISKNKSLLENKTSKESKENKSVTPLNNNISAQENILPVDDNLSDDSDSANQNNSNKNNQLANEIKEKISQKLCFASRDNNIEEQNNRLNRWIQEKYGKNESDCNKNWVDTYLADKNVDENEDKNIEEYLADFFKWQYENAENSINYVERTKQLIEIDELLNYTSSIIAMKWWENACENENSDENAFQILEKNIKKLFITEQSDYSFKLYFFIHNILPALADAIHEALSSKGRNLYTELFQMFGNSIRRYKEILFYESDVKDDLSNNSDVYAIPKRINLFIKSYRHPFSKSFTKPTRIVIDSLKSELEANYLRERYSAFYLFAISVDEEIRSNRLAKAKNLNPLEVKRIDLNEYPSEGYKIYHKCKSYIDKYKNSEDQLLDLDKDGELKLLQKSDIFKDEEIDFYMGVRYKDGNSVFDFIRKDAYESNLYQFVLQDVGTSIQNADVFISNNHNKETKNMDLRWELVRNVSLISFPGLVLPTPIERCMQIAFAAKANSGCLSRQVGAVVTDADYNILSIGWNDVPCGDISCIRKNLGDLHEELDLKAYTEYEINHKEFRTRIKTIYESNNKNHGGKAINIKLGLPWCYCFKDVHMDMKDPMRARSMHAEEKALSHVQNNAIGGCLFTTSSPCEMCSKNAKNHRIKKIYYIEPYPGISEDQYSNSGDEDNRAKHILFTGAIGRAYTQMYNPILPHKDILKLLGIDYSVKK